MAHGAPDHRLVIDLVELVKLINTIEKIDEVTKVKLIEGITSVSLIDRITRIDAIDSIGEVFLAKQIPLISPPLLLFDDFGSGLLKWSAVDPTYGRVELSNVRAFSGSASLRLLANASQEYTTVRSFSVTPGLTMRAHARFSLSPSNLTCFYFLLARSMSTGQYEGSIRYNVDEDLWQYYATGTGWTNIPGASQDLRLDLDTWHRLELEVNFATKKFVSLKVGPMEVDMSDISLWEAANGYAEYAMMDIGLRATADGASEVWVDDVFVEAW